MQVIEKSAGTHIDYEVANNKIIFGDDELSLKLANWEEDYDNPIDICLDKNGRLTMGVAAGQKYAAQVLVPARAYQEAQGEPDEDGNPTTTQEAVDFDIDRCTLYLFAID